MSRVHAPQPASPGVRCAAATGSIASLHAFHVAFYQRQSAWHLPLGFIYRGAWTLVELASLARLRWTLVGGCLRSSSFNHQALASFCPACGGGPWRGDKPTCGFRSWHCSISTSLALLLLRFVTFVVSLPLSSFYLLVLKLTARTTMKKAGS